MKKLTLDVDALRVESFAPAAAAPADAGTVRGFAMTGYTVCSCPSGCGGCTGGTTGITIPPPY